MLFTLQRYEFFSKSQLPRAVAFFCLGCCLPCKGTNFLANHNSGIPIVIAYLMLFTLQRYEFFSKSQLVLILAPIGKDVVYLAKVRIFQQITTGGKSSTRMNMMLFTLQRYEFFSKSQLIIVSALLINDVVYLAKVRIFWQITTRHYIAHD